MSAVTIGSRVTHAADPSDEFVVSGCLDISYNGTMPLSEALMHLNNVYDMNNALIDGFSDAILSDNTASGRIWIAINDDRIMTFIDRDDIVVLA